MIEARGSLRLEFMWRSSMRIRALGYALVFLVAAPALSAQDVSTRELRLTYVARVNNLPEDAKKVEIWIPVPSSNRHQKVSNLSVDSPLRWKHLTEPKYGNSYLYTVIEKVTSPELQIRVSFDVDRQIALFDRLKSQEVDQETRRRHLMPNRLVTISPRIVNIAKKVTRDAEGTLNEARSLYDYVLNSMNYDKSKPGWGHGDSERACDIRSGNCTDFHSLFISLSRARRIPARFIMGIPLTGESSGEVTGYHCWADFYLEGKGWVPVDISEAWKSKDPAVQNFLFGNLDFNRVEFNVGRDLLLENQSGPPLNYFIAPYVEVEDKAWPDTFMTVEYRNRGIHRPRTSRR